MAVKSATDTLEAALVALKDRRIELAKFLASPQTSRDDVSRWITQIVATQEAIKVVRKALEEQRADDRNSASPAGSNQNEPV